MESMITVVQTDNRLKRPFRARTILLPILFLLIHFSAQVVVQLLILFYNLVMSGFRPDGLENLLAMATAGIVPMMIISSLAQISVYLIYLYVQTRDRKLPFGVLPRKVRYIPGAAAVAFTALLMSTLTVQLFSWLGTQNEGVQRAMELYNTSASNMMSDQLALNILAFVILVPVAEELLFRAVITGELLGVVPDWAAVLIGGAVFALAHGNLIQSTYVLPAGILFGLVYVWSDSILLSIIMHMLYNLMGGIILPSLEEQSAGQMAAGGVVLLLALAGIAALVLMGLGRRRQRRAAVRPDASGDSGSAGSISLL